MRLVMGAVCLLLIGRAAFASPADLPPLSEVEKALDNYPGIAAASERVAAARAAADALRISPNEFALSAGYARRTIEREGRYGDMDATVSRTIRLPGKAGLDGRAGVLGVDAARHLREDARHRAALLLSELWYGWLEAGALVQSDDLTVKAQEAALAAVEKRVARRDAALLDSEQARAILAIARAQMADTQTMLEGARVELAATFPEITLAEVPPLLSMPREPSEGLSVLRDLVIERSHEVHAATSEAEKLSVLARRAQIDRIPDPTVGMRLFRERSGLERGVGVSVSVPLGWGYRRATAQRASAEASAAEFDSLEVRRQVQARADRGAAEVRTRLAAWNSMSISAESSEAAATRTRRGYEIGAIDLADMLIVQRQSNDARRAEITARADAARAVARLLIDSHTLWVGVSGPH